MTTYATKSSEVKRTWHLIDAEGKILGRLASQIANLLMGKSKINYAPYLDNGDYVVVINSEKLTLTGGKADQKVYRRHSGYPGGFKTIPYKEQFKKDSRQIIRMAVRGMLPKNRLRDARMARLKLFTGEEHPYEGKFKT